MTALYNEIDNFAADWLENLIAAGHIAPGIVDRRSIVDISPSDLKGFRQIHFFAGIGVWSYALRKAGWPDDRPIWTGSCPCQPFSAAGKCGGFDDERHLWPHFHYLIEQCRPPVVLGEQVASKDGLAWLDLVQSDLEGTGYACGAVDTCSASVGAPHIRQRLRFAAARSLDHATDARCNDAREHNGGSPLRTARPVEPGVASRLADANDSRLEGRIGMPERADQRAVRANGLVDVAAAASPTNGFWSNPDWLYCRDGKWRPVESGTFPLAHGAPARVGRLRAYGNAVDAEATREFCEAVMVALA